MDWEQRQNLLQQELSTEDPHILYQKIISKGRTLPLFPEEYKQAIHRVEGCQSLMYVVGEKKGERIRFLAYSDALISAGLAALLIEFYYEVFPWEVWTHPPVFLKELGILKSLSTNRAEGVFSLYKKMQTIALTLVTAPSPKVEDF